MHSLRWTTIKGWPTLRAYHFMSWIHDIFLLCPSDYRKTMFLSKNIVMPDIVTLSTAGSPLYCNQCDFSSYMHKLTMGYALSTTHCLCLPRHHNGMTIFNFIIFSEKCYSICTDVHLSKQKKVLIEFRMWMCDIIKMKNKMVKRQAETDLTCLKHKII